MLDASKILRRSAGQVSCNLDEEVAILNLEKSCYFGLAGVGAHIWQALETPCSVGQICQSVSSEFDVASETCRRDVLSFLDSLHEAGLIEVSD
jgi:hypothetical protein